MSRPTAERGGPLLALGDTRNKSQNKRNRQSESSPRFCFHIIMQLCARKLNLPHWKQRSHISPVKNVGVKREQSFWIPNSLSNEGADTDRLTIQFKNRSNFLGNQKRYRYCFFFKFLWLLLYKLQWNFCFGRCRNSTLTLWYWCSDRF